MDDPHSDPAAEDASYELFVRRLAHHEPELRRFIRSLLPRLTDADDVLQQTAIVCWRKFHQFDPNTNFLKWACIVARFEALAYRRKMARDRLVFREEVLELMADEGMEELDLRCSEQEALDKCLEEMPERQREFLILAYPPGIKVAGLAEKAGSTAAAYNRKRRRFVNW